HPGEVSGRDGGLVTLQRSDEVPRYVGEIGEIGHFPGTFLDVVFAEVTLPERVHRAYRLGRERLADGDEPHGIGIAPRGACRTVNSRAHVLPRLLVVEHNQ